MKTLKLLIKTAFFDKIKSMTFRASTFSNKSPFNGHIKTTDQRTIIQQYGDCYTGRWWAGCYIWYSEEGPGPAAAPPSPLLAVPNVTAHPSTASVGPLPTSYYSMWHYTQPDTPVGTLKGPIWDAIWYP